MEIGGVMERRLIRKRWQVTIPPGIRRQLNLYEGQLLNFDLVESEEQVFIRIYTGAAADPEEMAAFKELFGKKKSKERQAKCGRKFRKSDARRESRARRIEDMRKGLVPSTSIELQQILSSTSEYLLALQMRLKSLPVEF
jgi:bifunctional DNA-binding transcriptional regulator/antitoxin component of YhaV-PrlF toxin-antitoxin module